MDNLTINFNDNASKRLLLEKLKTLTGTHQIIIKKVRSYSTRYKYTFSHVYSEIAKSGQYLDSDGNPLSTNEIHEVMKLIYNPKRIVDISSGEVRIIAGATNTVSDSDFIGQFEEQIICDHSQPPYNIEFMSRSEWIEKWQKHYQSTK